MIAGTIRQATCIAIAGRAVLIEGAPGQGKSSLALMLIDRGAILVGDDGVTLSVKDGNLWAAPPPRTSGKIEIRNVGIVELPVVSAPVALCLELSADAPRYIEQCGTLDILGIAIPKLLLDGRNPAAAIAAEFALLVHGLPRPDGKAGA